MEGRESSEKQREREWIPEGMWWVSCSYSSNRYPAETDQQDQEMRNINEELEGLEGGRRERSRGGSRGGSFRANFSSPSVIVIPLNSLHFIVSRLSLFALHFVVFFLQPVISSLSLYSPRVWWLALLLTVRCYIALAGKWAPSSTELYNRVVANGRHWSSVCFCPKAALMHCSNYCHLNWEAHTVDAAV